MCVRNRISEIANLGKSLVKVHVYITFKTHSKGEEPGLAERLRRMDERLARLEEHLWPDEPPQGGGPGAWLSEEENDAAGSGGAAGGP